MMHLVVRAAFGAYKIGELITDQDLVARLDGRREVNRVFAQHTHVGIEPPLEATKMESPKGGDTSAAAKAEKPAEPAPPAPPAPPAAIAEPAPPPSKQA